jgi:hypothetical protein
MESDIAARALEVYELSNPRLRSIRIFNNAVFEVRTDAAKYALRVHPPGRRSSEHIEPARGCWVRRWPVFTRPVHNSTATCHASTPNHCSPTTADSTGW